MKNAETPPGITAGDKVGEMSIRLHTEAQAETIRRSYRRLEQEAARFPRGHRIVWRITRT